jgi:hypothetical protein
VPPRSPRPLIPSTGHGFRLTGRHAIQGSKGGWLQGLVLRASWASDTSWQVRAGARQAAGLAGESSPHGPRAEGVACEGAKGWPAPSDCRLPAKTPAEACDCLRPLPDEVGRVGMGRVLVSALGHAAHRGYALRVDMLVQTS